MLLSWCVFNSDDNIEAPDQTDCIHNPEVFLRKGVLKICDKFTGEHPCRSVISIKLKSGFIEIVLRHGSSPVHLLHIFRTPFRRNTSRRLLLATWKQRAFESSLILSTKTLHEQWNPTLRGFQIQTSFSKNNLYTYFHDVFLTLTLPHQHEDQNNLKIHHEKETYIRFKLFVLWYYTNIAIKVYERRSFYLQIQI